VRVRSRSPDSKCQISHPWGVQPSLTLTLTRGDLTQPGYVQMSSPALWLLWRRSKTEVWYRYGQRHLASGHFRIFAYFSVRHRLGPPGESAIRSAVKRSESEATRLTRRVSWSRDQTGGGRVGEGSRGISARRWGSAGPGGRAKESESER
jgi:hypothetical protein